MELTFVNTTNAPRLSRAQAKRMRAHVTKANFSERRRRKETDLKVDQEQKGQTLPMPTEVGQLHPEGTRAIALRQLLPSPLVTTPSDPYWPYKLLQSTNFAYWHDDDDGRKTAIWRQHVIHEPALFEGTLAINARYWSPDVSYQKRADEHTSRTISIVIHRIETGFAHTDGVLGAVTTMALGASLSDNKSAWDMHIDGMLQILQERRLRGFDEIPEWLTGILVLDIMNHVLSFPRIYSEKVVSILSKQGDPELSWILEIGSKLANFRVSIDTYRVYPTNNQHLARELTRVSAELRRQARLFRRNQSPYIRMGSIAIEIFLLLSWQTEPQVRLATLARKMKQTFRQFPVMQCPYMDLSSTPFILGAIAAGQDLETRSWFLDRLRTVVASMKSRGWTQPFGILERAVMADAYLANRFMSIWNGASASYNLSCRDHIALSLRRVVNHRVPLGASIAMVAIQI